MTKLFINGFGRIGRTMLRAVVSGYRPDIEIVGINDIAAPDLCAHLFEFDSVFGPLGHPVSFGDGQLQVGGHAIPLHQTSDLGALDLTGVDIVAECTGKAVDRATAARGLAVGANRVLISGPSDAADITIVLGANEAQLAQQKIISNASCTTNALAPLLRLFAENWGISAGWMTTIHCYTGSQPTIDAPRGDMMRSRAAALSMVPTTTSAQRLMETVLPNLQGRIEMAAVRVPVASVSAIDLILRPERDVDLAAVTSVLSAQQGIIGSTDRLLVSSDLRGRSESLIVALPELRKTGAGLVRIFGWYDNEWGFACRMLDMAQRMHR